MLCLRVTRDPNETRVTDYESQIKARLSSQLPTDCVLLSVETAEPNISLQPGSATYILPVHRDYLNNVLKSRIQRLLVSESLNLQRRINTKSSKIKNIDVRPFLKSIELDDRTIVIECKISPAGTIRVEEILKLLELDVEKLAAPIRRTNVQWQEV